MAAVMHYSRVKKGSQLAVGDIVLTHDGEFVTLENLIDLKIEGLGAWRSGHAEHPTDKRIAMQYHHDDEVVTYKPGGRRQRADWEDIVAWIGTFTGDKPISCPFCYDTGCYIDGDDMGKVCHCPAGVTVRVEPPLKKPLTAKRKPKP